MKRLILVVCALFLMVNCYGRRHIRRHHLSHRSHRSHQFFNPNKFLNRKENASRAQLSINNNVQELEKSKLRHQIEMEKLKHEQLNQKYRFEKEHLQKKLELLKLQKEIRSFEKK